MLALLLCIIPQSIDQDSMPAWRNHIAPKSAESRWQAIGWRQTVSDGLRDAAVADRPLLLWLMNGHPLGCT
jgi:hypothetical protein